MPRPRAAAAAALFAAGISTALAASAAGAPPPQQDAIVVARFVDAAAAYVRNYQTDLTSIVADEHYVQRVRRQTPRQRDTPLDTSLQSEVFFMFTPGHDWMTIRDVRKVDGRALEDRPDLRAALDELPAAEVASRFKAYNSRFNVGRVQRNFNEPTLGLLVLDDRHRARFEFTRARAQSDDPASTIRLAFRERRTPTLIRQMNGGPAFMTGEIAIDAATGRVDEVELTLTVDRLKVTLTTVYERDTHLGLHVPVRFSEHYEDGRAPRDSRSRDRYEEIVCEATYTNFRRFTVSTRIR